MPQKIRQPIGNLEIDCVSETNHDLILQLAESGIWDDSQVD